MRWTATDEAGWVAVAATVSPLGYAGRLEAVLAERRRLREQVGR